MFGAVAAGKSAGGYDSIVDCARAIGRTDKVYYPIEENVAIYNKLYAEYRTLHDYFGTGVNDVISFDLNTILLETDYGMVTIKGSNLHVNRLSVEKGEVDIDGKVDGINYSEISSYAKKGESFISRMFK
jgi:sporulation protein YabP